MAKALLGRRKKVGVTNKYAPQTSENGWTYFLIAERSARVKIGKTKRPLSERVYESLGFLNNHEKDKFRFLFAIDDSRLEGFFHNRFNTSRERYRLKTKPDTRKRKLYFTQKEAEKYTKKNSEWPIDGVGHSFFMKIGHAHEIFRLKNRGQLISLPATCKDILSDRGYLIYER